MNRLTASGSGSAVHAVVVTFLPERKSLLDLMAALAPQVTRVWVVDNTPRIDARVEEILGEIELPNLRLIRLGDNLGIARALNVGGEAAMAAGASHLLLSDQDSLPHADMVTGLLRAEYECSAHGNRVGAVGATFTDAHTGITFPFQAHVPGKFFYGHRYASATQPIVEALTLITSGKLIPAEVWKVVGPMREDFFIDYVDIEWCHRARAAGFHLYGTVWARMMHCMGDAQLRVWYFGWRRESAYSPLRVYYRIRNFIVLCKQDIIPARWKLRSAWYSTGFVYSQVIFGRSRVRALHMAWRGLRDGLGGHMGRFED